jgi:hypothetical protein
MQILKLRKETVSKVELANLMLHTYCLFQNIKINKTELDILSYFAVYGFKKSTKDIILRSKILNSPNSLENTITKLRKLRLLEKNRDGETVLIKELQFTVENKMGMIIKLENV